MPLADADKQEVQALIGEARKSMEAQVAKAQTAAENAHQLAQEASKRTALGLDDVRAEVQKAVAARDETARGEAAKKAETDAASAKVRDARAKYLTEHGARIPAAYLAAVPETDKPEDLAKAVEAAQAAWSADLASGKYGAKPADVGTGAPSRPAGTPDAGTMSPTAKIQEGLKEAK
jgi:hypothetical protein